MEAQIKAGGPCCQYFSFHPACVNGKPETLLVEQAKGRQADFLKQFPIWPLGKNYSDILHIMTSLYKLFQLCNFYMDHVHGNIMTQGIIPPFPLDTCKSLC